MGYKGLELLSSIGRRVVFLGLFNRPGVAKAVLQTVSLLNHKVIHGLPKTTGRIFTLIITLYTELIKKLHD